MFDCDQLFIMVDIFDGRGGRVAMDDDGFLTTEVQWDTTWHWVENYIVRCIQRTLAVSR
jgi:hypothetical protein